MTIRGGHRCWEEGEGSCSTRTASTSWWDHGGRALARAWFAGGRSTGYVAPPGPPLDSGPFDCAQDRLFAGKTEVTHRSPLRVGGYGIVCTPSIHSHPLQIRRAKRFWADLGRSVSCGRPFDRLRANGLGVSALGVSLQVAVCGRPFDKLLRRSSGRRQGERGPVDGIGDWRTGWGGACDALIEGGRFRALRERPLHVGGNIASRPLRMASCRRHFDRLCGPTRTTPGFRPSPERRRERTRLH